MSTETRDVFRRAISLRATAGCAIATLDDNFHTMEVDLFHASGVVTGARGEMQRFPWTTCPGAEPGLAHLVGAPMACLRAALAAMPRSAYCTHLGDLASLAAAQADRGGTRDYNVKISLADSRVETAIWRDGELLEVCDPEAVFVARRASHVAQGLVMRWGGIKTAADLALLPSCHSLQLDVAPLARSTADRRLSQKTDTAAPSAAR